MTATETAAVLAEMSAADLAVVVVTGCSVVAVVAVLFALQRLLATLRRVRRQLDEIHAAALPLLEDLSTSVSGANDELAKVQRLVGSAESISATVAPSAAIRRTRPSDGK